MTQITIDSKDFSRSLAVVSKVINRRNTLPILDNVLFTYHDGRFFLTGSNSEAWGKIRLAEDNVALISGNDFTSICLPTVILRQALASIPAQRITCDIDEDKLMMTVRHDSGHFSIPVYSAAEYPDLPAIDNPRCQIAVDGGWLVPRVKAAKVCVADDQLRPNMASVALVVDNEGMDVVGTNGQILYKDHLHVGVGTGFLTGEPCTVLIPNAVLDILSSAFLGASEVIIKTLANTVMLVSDDFSLAFRPVDGKYPNYNAVIPKQQKHHLTVNVSDMLAALKRASIFANESSNMVVLGWKEGHLIIEANDDANSQASSEVVDPAAGDNDVPDGFRIGMKAASLLAQLGIIDADNAVIELTERTRSVTIREKDINSHMVLLQMPMVLDEDLSQ